MNYYENNFAILESDYGYVAGSGTATACQYDSKPHTNIKTTGHTDVTASNVDAMKTALAGRPLSVSIEADKLCFQLYKSGVMDNTNCGTTLDHAVLAAGYGTENGQDYWLVKNSWGSGWGENGYIKLAVVAGDGICGVQMGPLYPNLA